MDSPEVDSSHFIVLLGDIFDLMIGNHAEYINSYSSFFAKLKALHLAGKRIAYFEGNHDLHLSELFRAHFPFIEVFTEPMVYEFHQKRIHFSHGDNFDLQNHSYQRYKKVLNSRFCKRLANGIMSYDFIKKIGEYSSRRSRERNYALKDGLKDKIQYSYRHNILQTMESSINLVAFGHSHFVENEQISKEGKNFHLLNNGFFPSSNSFIYITELEQKLISLS